MFLLFELLVVVGVVVVLWGCIVARLYFLCVCSCLLFVVCSELLYLLVGVVAVSYFVCVWCCLFA